MSILTPLYARSKLSHMTRTHNLQMRFDETLDRIAEVCQGISIYVRCTRQHSVAVSRNSHSRVNVLIKLCSLVEWTVASCCVKSRKTDNVQYDGQ